MANVKISELPAATLPLAGDELVPLVQGGVTSSAPASAFGGGASGTLGFFSGGSAEGFTLADGETDNLDPEGDGSIPNTFGILYLNGDAGSVNTITGMVPGQTDKQALLLVNSNGGTLLNLAMFSASSAGGNKFVGPLNNVDSLVVLQPFGSVLVVYDAENTATGDTGAWVVQDVASIPIPPQLGLFTGGSFETGDVAPSAGDNENYDPENNGAIASTTGQIVVDTSAGNATLTSMVPAANASGQALLISNQGPNTLTLKSFSGAATGQPFGCAADTVLQANQNALLVFNNTIWYVAGVST